MKLQRRTIKRARIEIIPMIDTILMLLVFYMSFSTFSKREKRFNARLPLLTSASAPAQVPLDIVLHVKDQNNIVVNGATTYDIPGLRDAMMQLTASGRTPPSSSRLTLTPVTRMSSARWTRAPRHI